ncbi:MAG: hypothetical protein JW388_0999 [Nitrospira sp.]|nr:hypothetical protein [Nitrospira sp.]
MPEGQNPLHLRTTQVQITVLQPDRLRDFSLIFNHKRRRLRLVQDLDRIHEYFDLTSREIWIFGLIGTGHHLPGH